MVVAEGTYAQTTSSMCMDVHVHANFVTESLRTLEKVRLGMHYADWKPAITASQIESIVWMFSPGHIGVQYSANIVIMVHEKSKFPDNSSRISMKSSNSIDDKQ